MEQQQTLPRWCFDPIGMPRSSVTLERLRRMYAKKLHLDQLWKCTLSAFWLGAVIAAACSPGHGFGPVGLALVVLTVGMIAVYGWLKTSAEAVYGIARKRCEELSVSTIEEMERVIRVDPWTPA